MNFAVVDLETTGGLSKRDKITEVGIVLIEDGKITEKFSSLVNPERSIPPEITRITGITNEMVAGAPKFYEIAKEIVLMTKGKTFVAHNVNFDYGFLRNEFGSLGYTYSSRKLCTVKLSRRLFPGLPSYGLSNLIKEFDLPMDKRHRALDDAYATAHLLLKILKEQENQAQIKDLVNYGLKVTQLPNGITLDELHALPESCGVYFFKDEEDRLLYVGKSNNIKNRVMQHFRKITRKAEKIHQFVHKIDYETTAGELIALLKEDEYIKHYQPPINKAQRKKSFPYAITLDKISGKNPIFLVKRLTKKQRAKEQVIADFHSEKSANARLLSLCEDMELCSCKVMGKKEEGCWRQQIGQCSQQGLEEDTVLEMEKRLSQYFDQDLFIIDETSGSEEKGILKIENGICTAYGTLHKDEVITGTMDLEDYLEPFRGSSYTNRIIFRELVKKKSWKIIEL